MAKIYDLKEVRLDGESRTDYRERTGAVKHPLVEKIFNEYAPKYKKRAEEARPRRRIYADIETWASAKAMARRWQ